ncbi:MAG: alpha-amylase family glycosyl hydrolase [Firmicutes bacterium]|nr:alpha-amylase family glycosyl hydrolase [Bacillota bacterium]
MIERDPWLAPFEAEIRYRLARHAAMRRRLLPDGGRLRDFANGHLHYGIHLTPQGWVFREWAPHAKSLHLIGDFNDWNRESHPLLRKDEATWEISLPGVKSLCHGQHVLVEVEGADGVRRDRIPIYIHRVAQRRDTKNFVGEIWAPDKPFAWTDASFSPVRAKPPLVYEAHIGMASEESRIGTYEEFTRDILPRIQKSGYNCVQLMGIMEHPYYASFGYQVTNFFAASAWYGTPTDLKNLINTAHEMGIAVLLDLIHAHASANYAEGIADFDGTDSQFFHAGSKGFHPAWGSRVFDYDRPQVLHFLLSNIKYWMTEFHFDGFRFDGVTSMLYQDHGLGKAFVRYDDYFDGNLDMGAAVYLMLANELTHSLKHNALTVAEDVSGMPGLCLPVREGGFGFSYRLGMGVPDFWIRTLEKRDEDWDMHQMWHELTTRRPGEPVIGYSECHDQAIVGDKTLLFRLADAAMYTDMEKTTHGQVIDRAMALIKMIRLITLTLAGEGYLNFMGNEFGHPEWIDFPREGNGWSYYYARRQWSLGDNNLLKYEWIRDFDRAMLNLIRACGVLEATDLQSLWVEPGAKLLCFRKAGLIFLFNFHPTLSQSAFYVPVRMRNRYQVIFSTDEPRFGGENRIDMEFIYQTGQDPKLGEGFQIYVPCRTAMVLTARG